MVLYVAKYNITYNIPLILFFLLFSLNFLKELMTKLITETPDQPIPFLIDHLQSKQGNRGQLQRTLSGSAALWAESEASGMFCKMGKAMLISSHSFCGLFLGCSCTYCGSATLWF